ncbi:MAG: hypothetical protein HFI33_04660 [Lachnospiraceae bacterium]|nr:hypothetical protein [Lachnospiraceae bacterium]
MEFFVRAFAWGIQMMLLYEGLRLFRYLVHHGTALVALEDLCYWMVYSLLLFRMMYLENDGMIRGFALLAVLLGMLLYLRFRKLLFFLEKKLQNRMKEYIMKRKRKKR